MSLVRKPCTRFPDSEQNHRLWYRSVNKTKEFSVIFPVLSVRKAVARRLLAWSRESLTGHKMLGFLDSRRSADIRSSSERPVLQLFHHQTHNEDCRLAKYEAALFAIILEDSIIQLKIIDSCNTEMRVMRTVDDMERLLDVKFGVIKDTDGPRDELAGVDNTNINSNKFKLIKLQNDRYLFDHLMRLTYKELTLDNSFCDLRQEVLSQIEEQDLKVYVVQDEAQNRIKRRELARQLRQQRVLNQSQIVEVDNTIDNINTMIEDVALNEDIRMRYVRNWQNARTEQHAYLQEEESGVSAQRIDGFKTSSYNEQRVHSELETLIAIDIEETLTKIEGWMDKYERDMEKIDLDMQYKKNDYQDAHDRRVYLEETIEKHDKAMEEWKNFKLEREKERKYREMMTNSAKSVQAWWRGLIVRKQLGPYRPPKKPKGKPKK